MFGLPFETALVVFGFPLVWVVYTAAFWLSTRHWPKDPEPESED